jgi:hypothetical protein
VIALAGRRPDDARPRHPLLFGPNEDDTGSVGAGVHFGTVDGREDCEPCQDVPVADDPGEIVISLTTVGSSVVSGW